MQFEFLCQNHVLKIEHKLAEWSIWTKEDDNQGWSCWTLWTVELREEIQKMQVTAAKQGNACNHSL